MEEDKKNINSDEVTTNNSNQEVNNSDSSSVSPLKDTVNNIASALSENNKYRSRRTLGNFNSSNNEENNTSSNSIIPNTLKKNIPNPINRKNNPINKMAKLGAKALLPNMQPALNTINTINNVKNALNRKKNIDNNNDDNNEESSNDGVTSKSSDDSVLGSNKSSSNDSSSKSSIFDSKNKVSGKFNFLGRLPKTLKIAIALAGPLIFIFLIIMIPVVVVGYFSSFWGLDNVLASNGINSGNIDYGNYSLSSEGDEILHISLDSFLESKGSSLTEFNNLISSNVKEAGYGTRAGVVAAAVTLIAELGNNYNVKVPYFWGGGHGSIANGAAANWGSNTCHTYANGVSYNYCGLDCSGFVSWAVYNGGFNISPMSSGTFSSLSGAKRVTLKNSAVLQAGDILDSNGHVILVVGIDEDSKEYICAEASGNTTGVLFSRKPFNLSGYHGVDMEGFYQSQQRS